VTSSKRLVGFATAACSAMLAASGALAGVASAATISVDKPCFVNSASGLAPMTITGTGFDPNDHVSITGGSTFTTATVQPTGDFTATANAPRLSTTGPGTRTTTLTATDLVAATGQTITATTKVESANLAVATKPGSIALQQIKDQKITFSFSGFTPGKHIYGFYLRRKVVAEHKFGKAAGPCGTLTEKALLYPGGHPTKDLYRVAFESSSRYSTKAFPRVVGKLSIENF
jgi:hypothetical protein